MKIFGDENSTAFNKYASEPGLIFGRNDVLKGPIDKTFVYGSGVFGRFFYTKISQCKLYLHIPRDNWTTFTGKLRQYLLPWRWKTAYLEKKSDTKLLPILVCTSVKGGLSDRLSEILNQSLFITSLANKNVYRKISGMDFFCIKGENKEKGTQISTMLEKYIDYTDNLYCHFYRKQSLLSAIIYSFLKKFYSRSWKEVTIKADRVSEKVLIKKSDEEVLSRHGLIVKN